MKERPILFNTQMVKAILDGRKTQTRRIIKPQPTFKEGTGFHWKGYMYGIGSDYAETVTNFTNWNCPMGRVGDRLWVRETFCYGRIDEYDSSEAADRYFYVDDSGSYCGLPIYPIYKQHVIEDGIEHDEVRWKPSIHMPRSASRILLEITKIRVERLQDISKEDAKAEGFDYLEHPSAIDMDFSICAKTNFTNTWSKIYGTDSWDANPWVWVVEFKVIDRANGDASNE